MSDPYDPHDPLAGIEPFEGSGRPPAPAPPPPGGPPARSPLLTGMVVGLLLVIASVALFQLFSSDGGGVPEATATTLASDTTTPGDGPATTAPGGTGGGGGGPTDTTGGGSGAAQPYTGRGEPIPLAELTLASDGVGPILLGRPADEAMGRLIASLGEPDSDSGPRPSTGEYGVCEGEVERIVTWGPFAAVVVVDPDGTETFAGFRLDLSYGGFSHDAAELATLSGISLGDSFRNVQETYDGFQVEQTEDASLGEIWTVSSSETGNLLLWGPLADGAVRGIYSPDACDRF